MNSARHKRDQELFCAVLDFRVREKTIDESPGKKGGFSPFQLAKEFKSV